MLTEKIFLFHISKEGKAEKRSKKNRGKGETYAK